MRRAKKLKIIKADVEIIKKEDELKYKKLLKDIIEIIEQYKKTVKQIKKGDK